MDDTQLLKLLKRDPDQGLRILTGQYMGLVCSLIRGCCAGFPPEDIEERVSDAFVEFYRQIDRIDLSRGTVKGYLCAIAKHKAADLCRSFCKTPPLLSLDEEGAADTFADDFSVEEEFLTAETRKQLLSAVKTLGEPDREIIVRKFYLREPSRDIAARLHMTVSAIDTRTHRALKKLKDSLGEPL